MKKVAIIPCYNAGSRLQSVIRETLALVDEVIFVDDGSTDDSLKYARQTEALIICHPKNIGKGAALKTGLARAKKIGADIFITIDSDGQHLPADIKRLERIYHPEKAAVVIGDRLGDQRDMPAIRRLANWASSLAISGACRQKIRDSQCGLRLFDRRVVESLDFSGGDAFEFETEFLIRASRLGFRIASTPITTIYQDHAGKIKSQFRAGPHARQVARVIFKNFFR